MKPIPHALRGVYFLHSMYKQGNASVNFAENRLKKTISRPVYIGKYNGRKCLQSPDFMVLSMGMIQKSGNFPEFSR